MHADLADDVLLCVQEACKNAIRFSGSPHGVLVRIRMGTDGVDITVRDFGVGMDLDALRRRRPAPLSESGRGLNIIRAVMDDVDVRVAHGTEVRMHKRFRPAKPTVEPLAVSA